MPMVIFGGQEGYINQSLSDLGNPDSNCTLRSGADKKV